MWTPIKFFVCWDYDDVEVEIDYWTFVYIVTLGQKWALFTPMNKGDKLFESLPLNLWMFTWDDDYMWQLSQDSRNWKMNFNLIFWSNLGKI